MNTSPEHDVCRIDPAPLLRGAERADGPVVAIVVSLTFPGMNASSHEIIRSCTQIACDAVREAGGRPRLVDSSAEQLTDASEVYDRAGGVLFLGGGDVDGEMYGLTGPPPRNSYGVDRRADEYCVALIREAVRQDLPTLAICRGSQLLNVAFGGTLVPDLEPWSLHRGGPGSPLFLDEEIVLEAGSHIADILGHTQLVVRSGHHQAVDRVADALWATARAHDGIVEATQHRTASWALGIQWHPEEPEADVADRTRIFGTLVERAAVTAAKN